MKPRTGNECRQALEEFQRGHPEVGGAIAVRGFELEDDLAGWCTAQACVAQGGTCDVATQAFEFLALMADLALREVPALGVLCDNITYGK
jgi:hypothetical protein